MKILLIEDDDAFISLLTRSLSSQHHIVDVVTDGEVGWTYASTFEYNLIILDIMLPKLDGISLCKKLRAEGYTMPILLLTAQDQTTAKVQGLDAGADDYMVKPFDIAELIARVRALLRRGSPNPLPLLSWGDLMLNPSNCDVTYNGQQLTLTTKEYDLLELFLRDSSHVFSSTEIIDQLWSSDDFPAEATVRSHLRRLRKKLQAAGAPHDLIATIQGRGYYLKSTQPENDSSTAATQLKQGGILHSAEEASHLQSEQYLSFLRQTWVTTKPQCLEQVGILIATVDRLLAGNCTYFEQQQAHHQAHKLVGTLGIFYQLSAMEIARKIERYLAASLLISRAEATNVQDLLRHLAEVLAEKTISPTESSSPEPTDLALPNQPLFLLIDLEPALDDALTSIAQERGFSTICLSMAEAYDRYLASSSSLKNHAPVLLLIRLSAEQEVNIYSEPLMDFMHNIHRQYPHWVMLILSEQDGLQSRLAVVRQGGKFLATANFTPEQIFTAALSLVHMPHSMTKIIVVDDDLDWLRSLPKLLQPWGLKVTTMASSQEFWNVLPSIQPDALVLDIKMPGVNGLELCQILRSDPRWQHLPILFLTASHDTVTQQAAFSVGADDYLQKPVMGGELAQRIRHRLTRIQARQVSI